MGGSAGQNQLFRNQGSGTFVDTTIPAGVGISGETSCGPTFADLNGDGRDDLFVGGQAGTPIRVFRNLLDGTFVDATDATGITNSDSVIGAALADVNGDSFLDLAVARWTSIAGADHLFYSTGDGGFVGAGPGDGLSSLNNAFGVVYTFTPNFADIDGDGVLDFLVSSDFGTSRYFLGNGDGTFVDATTPVISDESGMGASIGDYDNDGDLDWFVSSIWDPNGIAESPWGVTGNRLYKNLGDGTFEDATDQAGVRKGYWGWGSCFADFNLDGHLDLFHVNGFEHLKAFEFDEDPSVFFLNNGDGTFTERAFELGLFDISQGRGVACFDYDRDGDVDIFIATYQGPVLLYANNGAGLGHYLHIALSAPVPNTRGIGALVRVTAGGMTQSRPIRAGSNYASQDPPTAHFGLGQQTDATAVEIVWPNGAVQALGPTPGDQFLVVQQP